MELLIQVKNDPFRGSGTAVLILKLTTGFKKPLCRPANGFREAESPVFPSGLLHILLWSYHVEQACHVHQDSQV